MALFCRTLPTTTYDLLPSLLVEVCLVLAPDVNFFLSSRKQGLHEPGVKQASAQARGMACRVLCGSARQGLQPLCSAWRPNLPRHGCKG